MYIYICMYIYIYNIRRPPACGGAPGCGDYAWGLRESSKLKGSFIPIPVSYYSLLLSITVYYILSILEYIKNFFILLSSTEYYSVLLRTTEHHWLLLTITEYHCVLLSRVLSITKDY